MFRVVFKKDSDVKDRTIEWKPKKNDRSETDARYFQAETAEEAKKWVESFREQ